MPGGLRVRTKNLNHLLGIYGHASSKSGFTLVELLVVIAIIGLLIGTLITGRAGGSRSVSPHEL